MALTAAFTARASTDLAAIDAYFAERNPAAGAAVFRAIAESIRFLLEFPEAAPQTALQGVRLHPVPRTRYLLAFRVIANRLEVLRVLHQAQERIL